MVLEYKFEYHSNNNSFVSFIQNILNKADAKYRISRENNFIFLYIEDEEERLLKVSDTLSNKLPMSIFLKNFTLEVVPQIPNKDYAEIPSELILPHCSNCLANIENEESTNFYNPFFDCDICGTTCNIKDLEVLEDNSKVKYKDFQELFALLALKISQNKRIKIKTFNGELVYSKLNKKFNEKTDIICTDINELSRLVVSTKEKTVALLSLEKPSIDFNINAIYKTNNKIDIEKVNIRFSDSLILDLLSKELSKLGVYFIVSEESNDYDIQVKYTTSNKALNIPKITFNDSKVLILENENYDEKLETIYNSFGEKSKAQFMVLLEENQLDDKSILNLYLSSKYDDNICLFSSKIDGMLDILNFRIPDSISTIFDQISENETGKRLVENYKNNYPEEYEYAISFDIKKFDKNSIYSLWNIASIILGMNKNNSSENIILKNASSALLEKGPRVDNKILESNKIFNKEFNIAKFIQSGISFKLAGVDEKTLSLGYVESYSYFLANLIDEVNNEFELDGVSLCGDLISNELIYKLVNKAITKNFKIYYNKDFPIQK